MTLIGTKVKFEQIYIEWDINKVFEKFPEDTWILFM